MNAPDSGPSTAPPPHDADPPDFGTLFRASIHARVESNPDILFPSPYTRYTPAGLLRLAILAAELEQPGFVKSPRITVRPLLRRTPAPRTRYPWPYMWRCRSDQPPRRSPIYPPTDNPALFAVPRADNTRNLNYHLLSTIKDRLRWGLDPALYDGPGANATPYEFYRRLADLCDEISPLGKHSRSRDARSSDLAGDTSGSRDTSPTLPELTGYEEPF